MNISLVEGQLPASTLIDLFYAPGADPAKKAAGLVKNTGGDSFNVYVNGTVSTILPGAQQHFYAERIQIEGLAVPSSYLFCYVLTS